MLCNEIAEYSTPILLHYCWVHTKPRGKYRGFPDTLCAHTCMFPYDILYHICNNLWSHKVRLSSKVHSVSPCPLIIYILWVKIPWHLSIIVASHGILHSPNVCCALLSHLSLPLTFASQWYFYYLQYFSLPKYHVVEILQYAILSNWFLSRSNMYLDF